MQVDVDPEQTEIKVAGQNTEFGTPAKNASAVKETDDYSEPGKKENSKEA